MKTIGLYITILSLILVASCMELDQFNPNAPTVESFWKTEGDLYTGLMGAYALLQDRYYGDGRINQVCLTISDMGTVTRGSGELYNVARFIEEPWEFPWWNGSYKLISRAYQVIDRSASIGDTENILAMVGEAKFLVALAYYNLIQMYGYNIAYVDRELDAADDPAPRADSLMITGLMESLLMEAIPVLPLASEYPLDQYGRATRGAAQSLLGKLYMQTHQYEFASEQFIDVIESGQYRLLENYADNFINDGITANEEAIFLVNFTLNGPQGEDDENGIHRGYGIREISGMGIFSDIAPTPFILESFKKESDVDGNFDPRLDITLFHDSTSRLFYGLTYEEWRYSRGLDLLYDKNITTSFMKYSEQEGLELSGDSVITEKFKIGQTDFLVIRYADILLLQAEALNEIHNSPEIADELGNTAYDYVDMVRERSNMFPLSVAKPGLGRSEFLTQLQHERVVELAEECVRYFDLRRWGMYNNNNMNDTNFETWTSEDLWVNIPLAEREVNPNLSSNPGY
ncbi:MAG: RagB/SusD family nutrient uptake outer membrane protein [Bacteroidales bacterium]|nr:RagB/SusD family nutrient uptake outer membrane protein [Bacteroidales bacterium]